MSDSWVLDVPDASLWAGTAHEAVHRAVASQSHPIWQKLWAQCLRDAAFSAKQGNADVLGKTASAAEAVPKSECPAIVAAFVLSVPSGTASAPQEITEEEAGASLTPPAQVEAEECKKPVVRRFLCVSLGSGSRCLGVPARKPVNIGEAMQRVFELRDGHAEVMARRGFIAFLMDLAETAATVPASHEHRLLNSFLQRCRIDAVDGRHHDSNSAARWAWRLKEGVEVHLVCSRWMCGSLAGVAGGAVHSGHLLLRAACGCWAGPAQVEDGKKGEGAPSREALPNETNHFKGGANVRVCDHVLAMHHSELDGTAEHALGARVKPGRGPPNLTMSCTDKLWRWCARGSQGRRRAQLFPVPMRLSSVHVLCGPEGSPSALEQAVRRAQEVLRWRTCQWEPLRTSAEMDVVTPTFAFFTSPAESAEVAASATGEAGNVDSSYSRSRWLFVHRIQRCDAAGAVAVPELLPSRKRTRCPETENEEGQDDNIALRQGDKNKMAESSSICITSLGYDWQSDAATRDGHALVLNTKAGLPQGMSAGGLAQRTIKISLGVSSPTEVSDGKTSSMMRRGAEMMWRQFPLSRPWMAQRVLAVEAAGKSWTGASTNVEVQGGSSVHGASVQDVSMGQLVHARHTDRADAVRHQPLLLWTSRSDKQQL